jgi:hypothetical protein
MEGDALSKGRTASVVAALALLAAALRLPTLLHAGIWRDEANVYVELGASTLVDFLHRVAAIDYHPPLYFVLEYVWSKIAGVGEIAFESVPLAISIATVPAVYFLGKAAGSKAAGLLAAAFFAVAPLAITYSTDYLYPLAIFADTLLALQVTVARKAPLTVKQSVLTAGTSLFAVYSHYTALILIPLLVVWALGSPAGLRHGARVALAIVVGTLPFVLWLPVFLHQRQVGLPYDASPQPSQIAVFFVSALALLAPVPPSPIIVAAFAAALLVPTVVALRDSLKSDYIALGVVALGAMAIVSAAGLNTVRYVLPFCTMLYVCVAWLFVAIAMRLQREDPVGSRRWGVPLAAVLALALFVTNTAYVVADGPIPHSGIRTFMATVPVDEETLYVIAPDYMAPDLAYYGRGKGVRFLGFARLEHPEYYVLDGYTQLWNDPLIVQKAFTAIENQNKRYRYLVVIVDAWTHDAHEIPFSKTRKLLAKLESRYRLLSRVNYEGRWEPVSVYRFEMAAQPYRSRGAVRESGTQ